uniref:Uncharacterized protein n=1 Tax=Calidris pygmaea TaxID=425635 RepID=A0A8C3KMS0_9CHAR
SKSCTSKPQTLEIIFLINLLSELELPKLPGNRPTSPKISPRSSPRNSPCFFRKLLVNKSIRQRRRFTVAHTW